MPAVSMTVNGKAVTGDVEARTLLVEFLRENLRLTGTHVGCDTSQCGACVVHIDGIAAKSCTTLALQCEGAKIVTIEGLSPNSSHPLQKAWVAAEVPQCGYCQSGQIMKAAELLASNPKPSRQQIVTHMDGNICRCGTYNRIIAAIERASREG